MNDLSTDICFVSMVFILNKCYCTMLQYYNNNNILMLRKGNVVFQTIIADVINYRNASLAKNGQIKILDNETDIIEKAIKLEDKIVNLI